MMPPSALPPAPPEPTSSSCNCRRATTRPLASAAARLSGGEAQRIALARAFLREAPLVVLDEPTANLDPTTEAQIQRAIERLLQDRTALLIAHRLNTIPQTARVAVLDGGRVVETGNLETLMTAGGPFARLAARADCALPPLTGEESHVILSGPPYEAHHSETPAKNPSIIAPARQAMSF